MKTKEQELAELSQKIREETQAIEAKYKVLDLLGNVLEGYNTPFVHHSQLWGRKGSVNFGHCTYKSIREGKNPDKALLAALLLQFPPLPKVMYKDSCTSFRCEQLLTGKDHTREEVGEVDITRVCPITARLEVYQGPSAKFEWFADLGGEVWEIVVEIPLCQTTLGRLDIVPRYYGYSREIASYERCEFYPSNNAVQRIRWVAGDRKYPNSFTLWTDPDSGREIDWAGMVK